VPTGESYKISSIFYGISLFSASSVKKIIMKNKISLSISSPCSENWEHFTGTSQGRFCNSCRTNVVDFTAMSDEEIVRFFKNNSGQACGRFRTDQLRSYLTTAESITTTKKGLSRAGFVGLLTLLISKQSYSQQLVQKAPTDFVQLQGVIEQKSLEQPAHIVKGVVKDEYNQPLPGVNVYVKGTSVGTVTDANGNFEFSQKLETGQVLVFSFIGYVSKEYVVTKDITENTLITLKMDEMELMGAVAVSHSYTAQPSGIGKWWHKIKSLF
jgi:hypothetical protein